MFYKFMLQCGFKFSCAGANADAPQHDIEAIEAEEEFSATLEEATTNSKDDGAPAVTTFIDFNGRSVRKARVVRELLSGGADLKVSMDRLRRVRGENKGASVAPSTVLLSEEDESFTVAWGDVLFTLIGTSRGLMGVVAIAQQPLTVTGKTTTDVDNALCKATLNVRLAVVTKVNDDVEKDVFAFNGSTFAPFLAEAPAYLVVPFSPSIVANMHTESPEYRCSLADLECLRDQLHRRGVEMPQLLANVKSLAALHDKALLLTTSGASQPPTAMLPYSNSLIMSDKSASVGPSSLHSCSICGSKHVANGKSCLRQHVGTHVVQYAKTPTGEICVATLLEGLTADVVAHLEQLCGFCGSSSGSCRSEVKASLSLSKKAPAKV
jgi:hypothetical protein